MRIVFDARALVPVCLHPDREPAQVFRLAARHHELFSSTEALRELQVVLSRPKFEAWQPLGQRLAWLKLYQSAVAMIEPQEKVTDCRDSKDNKFLELALAANAAVIVSSDVRLLELHPFRGIEIVGLRELKAGYLG